MRLFAVHIPNARGAFLVAATGCDEAIDTVVKRAPDNDCIEFCMLALQLQALDLGVQVDEPRPRVIALFKESNVRLA